MTKLLLKLPWFLSAPLVLIVAGVFAFVAFQFTGDYFRETCHNERNLLTGEFEPSNCGEGAKVAQAQRTPTSPGTAGGAGVTTARGTFRDGDPGHEGSGTVDVQRLADGRFNVFLKDFSVTNGPELWVVLSTSADGSYADGDLFLEKLKANNGSQNYLAPPGVDLSAYRSVIIWCRPFRVTFARAPLEAGVAGGAGDSGTPTAPAVAAAATPSPAATAALPTPRAGGAGAASTGTPAPSPATTPTVRPAAAAATPTAVPQTPAVRQGVIARGSLRDGAPGHMGTGAVEVQRLPDGKLNIFIGNLSVTNGPDLFIVLNRSDDGDYSDGDLVLERLKANNGSQNYALPDGTDVSKYRSVSIWCRQFDTTFSYAKLEVQ